jgi:hypothetical protein
VDGSIQRTRSAFPIEHVATLVDGSVVMIACELEPAIRLSDPDGTRVECFLLDDRKLRRTSWPDGRVTEGPLEDEGVTWRFWHEALDDYGWHPGLGDRAMIPWTLRSQPGYYESYLLG